MREVISIITMMELQKQSINLSDDNFIEDTIEDKTIEDMEVIEITREKEVLMEQILMQQEPGKDQILLVTKEGHIEEGEA